MSAHCKSTNILNGALHIWLRKKLRCQTKIDFLLISECESGYLPFNICFSEEISENELHTFVINVYYRKENSTF